MTPHRVGILGGTFDPVHLGHLVAAEVVRAELDVDRVFFVPAGRPPHKPDEPITDGRHRLAMLMLATDENPFFTISGVDMNRDGPHYTVDMLQLLQAEVGLETELYFIMGADSLVELPTWRRPERIVELVRLVVVDRPGFGPELEALEDQVPGLSRRLRFVPMPPIGISATDLRRRVAAGRSIKYQVPDAVDAYIRTHGLYIDAPSTAPRPDTEP